MGWDWAFLRDNNNGDAYSNLLSTSSDSQLVLYFVFGGEGWFGF